jgi:hypothetical protein
MRKAATAILALVAASAAANSPAEAVAAAAVDMAKLPPGVRTSTRYLSLYNVPEKKRAEWAKVLDFHANSLSREAEFTRLRPAGAGLYALNIDDYGWKAATWERLLSAEPYFHAAVEREVTEDWPGGKGDDGKEYAPGRYTFKKRSKSHAPWLEARDSAYLAKETGSGVPIVRADWFVYQTAIQLDRRAGYYDFLGLGKKQADFEDLIGADREKAKKVKKEISAVLARSGVTLQNRAIFRFGAITGGYWVTADYKTSQKAQNVLRLLDRGTEPPEGDASEQYGFLPNGLFTFWLQNGAGERQDVAPDFIASDGRASGNDRRVHVGVSCVRCHTEGLRPIDDYVRRVFRGAVTLASPDYEKHKRLRQLYLSDLEGQLRRDRDDYARRLHELTALKPQEVARAYGDAFDGYAEADLGLDDAARELGVDMKTLLAALKAKASRAKIDPSWPG